MDLELSAKMTFEITKRRPNFDSALVRLSHPALAPLGGRLVVEFTSEEKWRHLQRFAEAMQKRRREPPAVEPPNATAAAAPLPPELSTHFELLVRQLGVMSAEQRLGRANRRRQMYTVYGILIDMILRCNEYIDVY